MFPVPQENHPEVQGIPPRDVLSAARMAVGDREVYWRHIVMSLRVVEKAIGTLGITEGMLLYFDPDVVARWGMKGMCGVVAHEARHWFFDHFARERDFLAVHENTIKQQWKRLRAWFKRVVGHAPSSIHAMMNWFEDAEINDGTGMQEWELPGSAIRPSLFGFPNDLTFEEYALMALKASANEPEDQEEDPVDGDGDGKGRPAPGCGGECGCGADPGEGDPEPLTEGEQDAVRRATAHEILSAAGRGTVPAKLRQRAEEEIAPPKVRWQDQLRGEARNAIMDAAGALDYSYKRPGRRSPGLSIAAGRGMITPCMRQPVPKVGIVLDTSGSMGSGRGSRIEAALSEVFGVVKSMRSPVMVWSVDAAVAAVTKVMPGTDIAKLLAGGGGTDMCVGIEAADKEKLDVIIVLTDGETNFPSPSEMPKARLIFAVVTNHAVPAHIKCVRVE